MLPVRRYRDRKELTADLEAFIPSPCSNFVILVTLSREEYRLITLSRAYADNFGILKQKFVSKFVSDQQLRKIKIDALIENSETIVNFRLRDEQIAVLSRQRSTAVFVSVKRGHNLCQPRLNLGQTSLKPRSDLGLTEV